MNVLAAFVPGPLATAPVAAPVAKAKCKCSATCTSETNRIFAQGHDARMVSILVAQVLSGATTGAGASEAIRRTGASEALVTKFLVALGNAVNKAQAKADRKAARTASKGKPATEVLATRADVVVRGKVGRWTYDGQVVDGQFRYTDKNDQVRTATKFTLV